MIFIITGHLGAGKSLVTVDMAMLQYLAKGRRVASNITLYPENALPSSNRATWTKLPYVPTGEHLDALGRGYEGDYDEAKFGLVILDEAGSWLNSRDWSDKGRRGLFTWITHARKKGWDVALIVQDWESLDTQIRRSVCEIFVSCSRLDRIKVPYLPLHMPKVHRATARYKGPDGMMWKRWHTRGVDAYSWYDTQESVREEVTYTETGPIDARGAWSGLSPWHLRGRYMKPARPAWERWAMVALALPIIVLQVVLPAPAAARKKPARRPVVVLGESLADYNRQRLQV